MRGWRNGKEREETIRGGREKILVCAWTLEHRSRSFKRRRREPLKYIGAREIAEAIKDSSFDVSLPPAEHRSHDRASEAEGYSSSRKLTGSTLKGACIRYERCCYRGMQIYFLNRSRIFAYLSFLEKRGRVQ
ncbi:hypothetical protein CDAR_195111 [Caerostris darwini]|uniref:Uncharacterized protein n=1 Tax=Caerostris darwini TaxID=1538125 RepID=A0AAV4X9N4_9ARAC|nr:hypothetical protein CDAR_195111 [Caerostris darwini]